MLNWTPSIQKLRNTNNGEYSEVFGELHTTPGKLGQELVDVL